MWYEISWTFDGRLSTIRGLNLTEAVEWRRDLQDVPGVGDIEIRAY